MFITSSHPNEKNYTEKPEVWGSGWQIAIQETVELNSKWIGNYCGSDQIWLKTIVIH